MEVKLIPGGIYLMNNNDHFLSSNCLETEYRIVVGQRNNYVVLCNIQPWLLLKTNTYANIIKQIKPAIGKISHYDMEKRTYYDLKRFNIINGYLGQVDVATLDKLKDAVKILEWL